jgi:hypothetical protein
MDENNFENMVSLQKLWNAGVDKKKILEYDLLVLPENIDTHTGELYDAQNAITLSKLLKSEGIKCANSYDLGLEIPTTERRSNDIWLGQLYILNDIVLPTLIGVVTGVLSSLITDWKNRKDLREPAGNVHADITIIRPEGKIEIHYNGEPEALVKIIKTLKKDHNAS